MAEITAKKFDASGSASGDVQLDSAVFGIDPHPGVMHQVVTAQLAGARSGSAKVKTRAEVRGGGRKPWRQKGLGRARHGSIRSPQWRGGGVVFGPTPRSYAQRTPKKMKALALRSALSVRAAEGKVIVVDRFDWDTPKTKQAAELLRSLGVDGKVLIVLTESDQVAVKSFRNLPQVMMVYPGHVTTYDVLWADTVMFTSDTIGMATGNSAYAVSDSDFVLESDGGEEE